MPFYFKIQGLAKECRAGYSTLQFANIKVLPVNDNIKTRFAWPARS